MEGLRTVLAVCFHLSITELYNTDAQEPNAAIAGVLPLLIMTQINSGDSVLPVFCAMAATQMGTVVIFLSNMAGKCIRPAPLRMIPSHGVPPLTTAMLINNGVTVEVGKSLLINTTSCYIAHI